MRKYLIISLVLMCLLGLYGCNSNKNTSGKDFKEEYESLNGKESKSGKEHRTVNIDENNVFQKVTPAEILEMIKNKETFYVYFGDKLCPWCRSVIEEAVKVSIDKKIKKIYYVAIWDEDGNEVLRDKYEVKDGEISKTVDGTKEYYKLLKYFDSVLSDYTISSGDDKIDVGEKRIYAPNFIYIKEGKAIRLTEGISEKQKDSREELTEEILKDEEELFNKFFK